MRILYLGAILDGNNGEFYANSKGGVLFGASKSMKIKVFDKRSKPLGKRVLESCFEAFSVLARVRAFWGLENP